MEYVYISVLKLQITFGGKQITNGTKTQIGNAFHAMIKKTKQKFNTHTHTKTTQSPASKRK